MMAKFRNVMATYTNMSTSTPTYMAANNLSILINVAAFQEPWSDPAPHVNCLSLSSNDSVNYNGDNYLLPPFNPHAVPYEDSITDTEFFYDI